jgi:hypothetical protein
MPLRRLRPYGKNARTHSKQQIGQIAESIRSVAGVRGLELGNVALRNAVPNSLAFQNNFVPETFRGT